jgi:predicted Zn-dependent protease with MMP-like domain
MRRRRLAGCEFGALVRRALESIPEDFRRRMENVAVEVEDRPSRALLRSMGVPAGESLYGVYEGTPLTERTHEDAHSPAKVVIFRGPLVEDFGADAGEIVRQVRATVLHELGHHFGMEEADMPEADAGDRDGPRAPP